MAVSSGKKALVVEGGAMRGVFSTGVLDAFLEHRFNPFDIYIGVSSGAGNLAAYLAEMQKRNLKIYTDYSLRPEFISIPRFIRGGHLMDLDWLWRITISEIRLDLATIDAKDKLFFIGLTDVVTGKAVYKRTSHKNLEDVLKASSALPILYRNFPLIDGRPMADGGLSDPIPVAEAIRLGANRIMVIRSRPKAYQKKEGVLQQIMLWKLKRFPLLKERVGTRIRKYNDTISLIRKPPPDVSIVEICPPADFHPARLTQNYHTLIEGYKHGINSAEEAERLWRINED